MVSQGCVFLLASLQAAPQLVRKHLEKYGPDEPYTHNTVLNRLEGTEVLFELHLPTSENKTQPRMFQNACKYVILHRKMVKMSHQ